MEECRYKEVNNINSILILKTSCNNILNISENHGHMQENDLIFCPFCGKYITYRKKK